MRRYFSITIVLLLFASCEQKQIVTPVFSNEDISRTVAAMTEIMVHDVTNPPLAARFFSYACLAGYEIVSESKPEFKSMHGMVNEYPVITKPNNLKNYSYQLSALLAIMELSKKMQPSGSTMMLEFQKKFLDSCKNSGIENDVIEASIQYAEAISKQILEYAKTDKYNKISGLNRYQPINKDGYWFATPPGYLDAVEPHFNTIRPFFLDSAAQFKPEIPIAFSSSKNSKFYKEMLLLTADSLSEEQKDVAAFWDCNPFAIKENGHLVMAQKKISPGAHWLGITGIACKDANKNFDETMLIFAVVSMSLMDGFMSCWDEKYRSNRIRPETAIRKYIDPTWKPLLQTPPFPEYTSGHSVASGAASTTLTHFFGDNFSYTDTVEVSYGLPPRRFESFNKAASEAAISRFYGGIHYMDAINNGLTQGKKIGMFVVDKIKKSK